MDVVKNIWADILQVVIGQTQEHFLMMFVTVYCNIITLDKDYINHLQFDFKSLQKVLCFMC